MKQLTAVERARFYERRFPQYSPFAVHNGRIYGVWIIGSFYKKARNYYGAFPGPLLKRILGLFPDRRSILHLFSGCVSTVDGITYDINPALKPTICDDIRNLTSHREPLSDVDLVVADPPYEPSDFAEYGQEPFNKAQVVRDLGKVLRSGACVAWLDLRVPTFRSDTWELLGYIGIVISSRTRVRLLTLLERR